MKPEPQRKPFKVSEGNASVMVSPWKGSRWRYLWRPSPDAPWQYTSDSTKAGITKKAKDMLRETAGGGLAWSALPRERRHFLEQVHNQVSAADQQVILDYLASRKKSGGLGDAVARFLAYKIASKKGTETAHLAQVRRDLESLAESFGNCLVTDVSLDALAKWWIERTGAAGDARRKGIRTTLVMFWTWARKDGVAGTDPDTVAQRLPSVGTTTGKLEIFTRPELEFLLSAVERQWFPFVVLGAFQGIRPEEIAPKKSSGKPGLRWESFDWEFDSIRLPREVAKGSKRERIMPLHPVTRSWLEAYGVTPSWTGRICLENPTEVHPRATTAWGKALTKHFPARFSGWPQDALRHSYASHRNAVLRNLVTVAEEMGTSESMLHGHYHNPRTRQEGEAYFGLFPEVAQQLAPYLKLPDSVPTKSRFGDPGTVSSAAKAG